MVMTVFMGRVTELLHYTNASRHYSELSEYIYERYGLKKTLLVISPQSGIYTASARSIITGHASIVAHTDF
jgi:hypothetical protein